MTSTAPLTVEPTRLPRSATPRPAKRWSWAHLLAAIGAPILVWNAWTVIAWLADGPSAVTAFRDRDSVTWYAARAIETVVVLASTFALVRLVRGCRRAGRVLTFDVMFCLVGATWFWNDFGMNIFQPVFVASSNFVNVNNPCGHIPFIVNPDCGRAPHPILFFFLTETFLVLLFAVGVSKLLSRARARWPGMSTTRQFGMVLGMGFALALTEIPIVALGVWTYAGPRWMSFSLGHGTQYSPIIWLQTGLLFGLVGALYAFRNDKGQTIVERGLEAYSPRTRTTITMLALYGAAQFLIWVPGTMPMVALSFFQDGWSRHLPAHLVNDVCDVQGTEGTRYGLCPGSPGNRMPGRHSLPGQSP
jgi:hypothetical protein